MYIIVLIITTVLAYIINWYNNRLNYFKNRNIPYLKSFPLIGALTDAVIGKKGIYDCIDDIYNNPKLKNKKFFGAFMFYKPVLFINDPEIIKQVLVKDFNSFSNHHTSTDDHDPVGISMLFSAKDSLWRSLRKKMTPFFTSGKLKSMFSIFDKISDNLVLHVNKASHGKSSVELDVKDQISLFTVDCIASCAFGVDANSFDDPKSEFVQFAKENFKFTIYRGIEFTSSFLLPEITKFFNFKALTKSGEQFMQRIVPYVISEREKSKISKNDLVDSLIVLKNSDVKDNKDHPLTMNQLIAQAAIFFIAGYETSSTVTTFLLYEIAKNLDVQDRLRNEIREVLKKTNGKVTYEVVMHDTPYLHQVLLETIRLYPILPFLDRECSNPNGYSMKPFSDFVVPYKMPILIPVYGIQRDEKYFPNPLKFDPERFSPENIDNVPAFTNLPFGIGNRSCVGERLGLMQSKVAIIKILMNFRVEMTDETPSEIKLKKNAIVMQSEKPIVLSFVKDKMNI